MVVVLDANGEGARKVAEEIGGSRALPIQADVAKGEDIREAVATICSI